MPRAKLEGGPFQGRELDLPDERRELLLDDMSSGRIVPVRYVLDGVDNAGARHYSFVPTGKTPK